MVSDEGTGAGTAAGAGQGRAGGRTDRKLLRAAKILAAAEEILREGDGALEMSQVAGKAGVSVGLAYHYFGSKAGMLGASGSG